MDSIDSSMIPLVSFLFEQAQIKVDITFLKLAVMDDGGMGSHRFENSNPDAQFGKEVARCTFTDADGIVVSATLNLDQYGNLFELDLFKGDFSKLIKWPKAFELNVT